MTSKQSGKHKPDNSSKVLSFGEARPDDPVGRGLGEVDLNCDMGEGIGNDVDIMPFISSANIACGYHAGDEETMNRTIELAMQYGVSIGAHPSFPDMENFGRKEMYLDEQVLYDIIVLQIQVLDTIAESAGITIHHVKPHGALYNMGAKDPAIAAIIARSVKDIDPSLVFYGLSGSHLINEAKNLGLKTASEVFADRTYQDDGSLTPRSQAGALIEVEKQALQQVLQMIKTGTVQTISGKTIPIIAETICIHGDGKHAAVFAKKINEVLKAEGIMISSPHRNIGT